jgi:hypothetical protein
MEKEILTIGYTQIVGVEPVWKFSVDSKDIGFFKKFVEVPATGEPHVRAINTSGPSKRE